MASRHTCQGVQQEVCRGHDRVAQRVLCRARDVAHDSIPHVGIAILHQGKQSAHAEQLVLVALDDCLKTSWVYQKLPVLLLCTDVVDLSLFLTWGTVHVVWHADFCLIQLTNPAARI